MLRDDELAPHYESFGPHQAGSVSDNALRRLRIIRKGGARRAMYLLAYRLRHAPLVWPVPPGGRLLDVGCGSGDFLVRMRTLGWDVMGQDAYPNAGRLAREQGIEVFTGALEALADSHAGQFDVVTAWHVLEHIPDPVSAVVAIRELLREGGELIAEVPNAGCWEQRFFGKDWWAWMPPLHIHHFAPSTLGDVVSRAGLQPRRSETFGSFAGHALPGTPRSFRRGLEAMLAGLQGTFGRGANLRVSARKAGS